MKKSNLIHARTCVYNVNYHIVWSVKYRRKVLTVEVEQYMRGLIQEIAQDKRYYRTKTVRKISRAEEQTLEWRTLESLLLCGNSRKYFRRNNPQIY